MCNLVTITTSPTQAKETDEPPITTLSINKLSGSARPIRQQVSTSSCQATFVNYQRTGVLSVCHRHQGVYQKTLGSRDSAQVHNQSNSISLTAPKMTRWGVDETLAASLHARIGRAMKRMRMREQDAGGPRAYLGAGLGVEGNEGVLDGARDLLRRRALPRSGPEEEGHLAAGRRKSRWNRATSSSQSVSLVGS